MRTVAAGDMRTVAAHSNRPGPVVYRGGYPGDVSKTDPPSTDRVGWDVRMASKETGVKETGKERIGSRLDD